MPEALSAPTLTDDNGVRYTPILGGYEVTLPDGEVKYLYLNPSSEDSDGLSNVFVYYDEGDYAHPECYIPTYEVN